jgi:hypothetical protein
MNLAKHATNKIDKIPQRLDFWAVNVGNQSGDDRAFTVHKFTMDK